MKPHFFVSLPLGLACVFGAVAKADRIYTTDFSNFPVGDDKLVGTDGWVGTNVGEKVHGIDDDFLPGNGKTAFLGYGRPSTDFISVLRPVETNGTVITFQAVVGVADSDNNRYDRFLISIYNQDDKFLAGIVFDNTIDDFGLWAADGEFDTYTQVDFDVDVVYDLRLKIDLARNLWSAFLDDDPIFQNWTFTATKEKRILGGIAAQWEVVNLRVPGNNWLLFDDWVIDVEGASGFARQAPSIQSFTRAPTGFALLGKGTASAKYQVEYSLDLQKWLTDLPNSLVEASAAGEWKYTDPAPAKGKRFYRVRPGG